MRDIIDEVVRAAIAPVVEQQEQIKAQLEEAFRRLRSMVRIGKVLEVDPSHTRIRVRHGELTTSFIPWLACGAGDVIHYRCPSINETVILLNFGAGDTSAQTIALAGVTSEQFPFPVSDPDIVQTKLGEQCLMQWNKSTGELLLKAAKKITFDTELVYATKDIEAAEQVSDKVRSMSKDRDIYNGHKHKHGDPITDVPEQKQ